ncbi:hypothetical protein [Methylobacterium mesophilicum]
MSIVVKDANGANQTIQTAPPVGSAASAASLPVVIASDQSSIPVTVAALPLPAGAATATSIAALSTAFTGALTPTGGLPVALQGTAAVTQSGTWTVGLSANATVALAGGNTVALKVDGSAVTQPVSLSALPLPSGAATATAQGTGNTSLTAIAAASGAPADTAAADDISAASVVALLKRISAGIRGLLTVDTVVKATSTSRSGTIAAGGTSQPLMPANTSRRGFVIQNQSPGDLYINGLATATADQNSLKISSGDYYETQINHVGTGALSIIGATTGQAFYSREY